MFSSRDYYRSKVIAAIFISGELGKIIAAIRAKAEAADPRVAETRGKLIEAASGEKTEHMRMQESLRNNPQWLAARKELDDARTRANLADHNLSLEVGKLARAEAIREQALRRAGFNNRAGRYNNRSLRF